MYIQKAEECFEAAAAEENGAVYICVYTHIYIYIYMYICMYVYICTYLCVGVLV